MGLSGRISGWIKEKVEKAGAKGAVFGLSGGLDSACVAVLAKKALGDNILGVIMPCLSHSDDEKYVKLLADKFNIKNEKICLDSAYQEFLNILPEGNDLSRANIKPRLRMITLYYFANNLNYLTAGTGNKSELSVGYFTKYGDGGVDMLPLGDLYKNEVRELAGELGVPDEIIKRPPTAGLWQGQTDEAELGMSYEELDKILNLIDKGEEEKAEDKDSLLKIKNMIAASEHKRASIPVFKK